MDADLENDISMLLKVQAFLNENETELLAELPALPAIKTDYDGQIVPIIAAQVAEGTDITGFAEAKELARANIEESTFKVGSGCASYYTFTVPNPIEKAKVDWNASELTALRDSDMYVAGVRTWQIADPLKLLMAGFSVVEADVNLLNTRNGQFLALLPMPREKAGERVAQGREVRRLVRLTKNFLDDKMDTLMAPLAVDNPLLFGMYGESRKIDDAPGGQGSDPKIFSGTVTKLSVANVEMEEVTIAASTPLVLRNKTTTSNLTIQYYFSSAPAIDPEPGVTPLAVLSNNEQEKSAATLGFLSGSRTILNVRNPDANNDQEWEVEV